MGEQAGAGILALALALLGFGLIVAGIRGTYGAVWQAVKTTRTNGSSGTTGNPGGGGGGGSTGFS